MVRVGTPIHHVARQAYRAQIGLPRGSRSARRRKTVSIEGEVPSFESRPSDCEFHTRKSTLEVGSVPVRGVQPVRPSDEGRPFVDCVFPRVRDVARAGALEHVRIRLHDVLAADRRLQQEL